MRMRIDKAGANDFASGVDGVCRGIIDFSDRGYFAVAHRHVGTHAWRAVAVDDRAVFHKQIVGHAMSPEKCPSRKVSAPMPNNNRSLRLAQQAYD